MSVLRRNSRRRTTQLRFCCLTECTGWCNSRASLLGAAGLWVGEDERQHQQRWRGRSQGHTARSAGRGNGISCESWSFPALRGIDSATQLRTAERMGFHLKTLRAVAWTGGCTCCSTRDGRLCIRRRGYVITTLRFWLVGTLSCSHYLLFKFKNNGTIVVREEPEKQCQQMAPAIS